MMLFYQKVGYLGQTVVFNLYSHTHMEPITDSILSIPGSGDYIQRKIQIHSRMNQGLLHLAQMKQTLQYMLNMVESTEHETGAEKFVLVFCLSFFIFHVRAWIRI